MKSTDIKDMINQTLEESVSDNKSVIEMASLAQVLKGWKENLIELGHTLDTSWEIQAYADRDEEVDEKKVTQQLNYCLKEIENLQKGLPDLVQKIKKGIAALK